ncbi:Mu transposase C-terminal domain-containing protein [Sphingopyxis sp.]|uniref:Mu transposase C-terminal domain-containing protein n=1 Tax=Sphingopyxis sp. TaxID=1908224 RepID=UPI0010F9E37F|nr:Mu transposase C-terminal domain-containing protein [Sphingopyxis sp.]MBR2173721.1 DDE-type integrase/transposase/recombinase [Sphingopyxis sp.]
MAMIETRKGAKIVYGGQIMKVVGARDLDVLTLLSPDGEYFDATLADLQSEAEGTPSKKVVVDTIRQSKVPAYVQAFRHLLGRDRNTRETVAKAGEAVGISLASAYKVLERYRQSGNVDELPPPTRPGGKGKSRLKDKATEEIIQKAIDELLLTRRNGSTRNFYKVTKRRLEKAGKRVSQGTLRLRVAKIPANKWNKARKGFNEAKRTDDPIAGEYPDIKAPLDVVQIDHWRADIEIVSEDRLTVIGRVWITLAIDIYSRMVFGMHVSLDPPSTTTMGLCMINGMLRKDAVAERYGLKWDNPIAGPIGRLEADNAGEFTGNALQASADHFNFRLKWRPLGAPQYGGHIERLNGNLAQSFKDLPGATGSTAVERKLLRPEVTAAFTLEDLTRHVWLLIDGYHNDVHTGIGSTPLEKYRSYFFGPEGQKRRLPPVYVDNIDFRRQWYPLETRTLQRYGIRIDYLDYYSDELRQLVKNRKKGERFLVRRNPFDVREVHFYHPGRDEWIIVPARQIGYPVASIFEQQQAKKEALKRKRKPTPELLANIIDEQHRNIEEAVKKTKTAQRYAARRQDHKRLRDEQSSLPDSKALPKIELAGGQSANRAREQVPASERQPVNLVPSQKDDLAAILASIDDNDIEDMFV